MSEKQHDRCSVCGRLPVAVYSATRATEDGPILSEQWLCNPCDKERLMSFTFDTMSEKTNTPATGDGLNELVEKVEALPAKHEVHSQHAWGVGRRITIGTSDDLKHLTATLRKKDEELAILRRAVEHYADAHWAGRLLADFRFIEGGYSDGGDIARAALTEIEEKTK